MNGSKLKMVLAGAAVLALSVIALWRFSLPGWATGIAMVGGLLGFAAMATPLVPEGQGGGDDTPGDGGGDDHEAGETGQAAATGSDGGDSGGSGE